MDGWDKIKRIIRNRLIGKQFILNNWIKEIS